MPMLVRAFPLLADKEDLLRDFVEQVSGPRRSEIREFYESFGVTHESWHVQDTPQGRWIIGVTEVRDDLATLGKDYAASARPFDRWFKDRVMALSGINPDVEPLGPPTQQIFEFNAEDAAAQNQTTAG